MNNYQTLASVVNNLSLSLTNLSTRIAAVETTLADAPVHARGEGARDLDKEEWRRLAERVDRLDRLCAELASLQTTVGQLVDAAVHRAFTQSLATFTDESQPCASRQSKAGGTRGRKPRGAHDVGGEATCGGEASGGGEAACGEQPPDGAGVDADAGSA